MASQPRPDIQIVDRNDNLIGAKPMREAYENNDIVRIARVMVFNAGNQLLLQQRSANVRWPNKWNDSAAGHVDEGETYKQAALRELNEELGIDIKNGLEEVGYYFEPAILEEGLIPRFNKLYKVSYDGDLQPSPREVQGLQWISLNELNQWAKNRPDDFTSGFRNALARTIQIDS